MLCSTCRRPCSSGFRNNVPFSRISYQCFSLSCTLADANLIATRVMNREENIQGITWS